MPSRTAQSGLERCLLTVAVVGLFALSGVSGVAFAASSMRAVSVPQAPLLRGGLQQGPDYYHWYAGGVFSGTSTTATEVNSNITIPSGAPPSSNQFYYVILSIWDNTGSYDQIGFANNEGTWGLAYSYTTGFNAQCEGTINYHYSSDAKTLQKGTTYDFFMTISGGTVYFSAYSKGSEIWSLSTDNGATSFSVAGSFCGYYDYTVYEEAYMNTQTAVPNHNFNWAHNDFGPGGYLPTWQGFTISAPSKVHVVVSGPDDSQAKIVN